MTTLHSMKTATPSSQGTRPRCAISFPVDEDGTQVGRRATHGVVGCGTRALNTCRLIPAELETQIW